MARYNLTFGQTLLADTTTSSADGQAKTVCGKAKDAAKAEAFGTDANGKTTYGEGWTVSYASNEITAKNSNTGGEATVAFTEPKCPGDS